MTTEELIQAFPECEKIKRENIAECITKAMTEERFYAEASDKIYRKAHELWPYQRRLKDGDPERVAYAAYFWGNTWKGVVAPFKEWQQIFEAEFIAQHGQVRTFDEACQAAADEWARMIFGNHIQNNGDQSDAGGLAMVLGTLAKESMLTADMLTWGVKATIGQKFSKQFAMSKTAQKVAYNPAQQAADPADGGSTDDQGGGTEGGGSSTDPNE